MPRQTRRTGRYGLLLLATVLSVAVQGTVDPGAVQQVIVTGLAGACLLLAFRAANLTPRLIQIAGALAIAALAVALVRATAGGIGDGAARCMNAALVALGPPAVAVGVVRDLRTTGRVRIEAVFGVLSLYMLIGMAFGFIYGAIDQLGGAPFFAGGQTATVSHCLYFSLTTLSTVGYGDFVARTDLGHTLAVSEALVGQIYLVTVVSLIVSNLGRPARRDDASPET
jgi:Ion channel